MHPLLLKIFLNCVSSLTHLRFWSPMKIITFLLCDQASSSASGHHPAYLLRLKFNCSYRLLWEDGLYLFWVEEEIPHFVESNTALCLPTAYPSVRSLFSKMLMEWMNTWWEFISYSFPLVIITLSVFFFFCVAGDCSWCSKLLAWLISFYWHCHTVNGTWGWGGRWALLAIYRQEKDLFLTLLTGRQASPGACWKCRISKICWNRICTWTRFPGGAVGGLKLGRHRLWNLTSSSTFSYFQVATGKSLDLSVP